MRKPSNYIYDAEDEQFFEEVGILPPAELEPGQKSVVPVFSGELDIFCPIHHGQGAIVLDGEDA